jgi:hypothetical protein
MNPEEKRLLERTLKLSEENNEILRSIRRKFRWAILWGVIKFAVIAVPLIIGYLYLEPYFGSFSETFKEAQQVLQVFR